MIKAKIAAQNKQANLRSYDDAYRSFSWSEVEKSFAWSETGKLNIVHEAIDRWAGYEEKKDIPAMIFESGGKATTYSYFDLKRISCQWAHLLKQYGFEKGDRLFIFLTPCPQVYFAMLACARLGVVFCPLFSTLNFDELEERLESAKPRAVLTHPDLGERLSRDAMDGVDHVFYTQGPAPDWFKGEVVLEGLPETMPEHMEPQWLSAEAPLYLLFTSGSTGPPKGVVHGHGDMAGHLATAKSVLDLCEGTVLWADCDPSWVTGTVYGAFAPWLCTATSVVQAAPFSASTWYRTLERYQVEVWYKTPRNMRMLKEAGDDLTHRYDFSRLRHIAAVGEALEPELIYWFKKNFHITPHDNWWMTETGMICLANFPSMDIKPGSMGKAVPGIQAAVVDEKGRPLPDMTMGELALRPGWPAMMIDIWQDRRRYEVYFKCPGWFLTGDMVIRDEDGYYYHQGRTDDLIKAGVKLIGPYEIERALCGHPAVSEAAVISAMPRTREPALKAFVTINKGFTASARLNQEIKAYVKANLSLEVDLKEVSFIDEMPKTRSGKILRRALRTRQLGLPIGDTTNIKEDR